MGEMEKRLYKGRVALNVLAKDPDNAEAVFAAADGHVLIGVLSKNYASAKDCVGAIRAFGERIDGAVSVGLGAGDSRQAAVVAEIARLEPACHVNQVFPYVGATRANAARWQTWINALVAPCGRPGWVNVSTGPISAIQADQAVIPARAAIALVKDMGGNALKFFPMKGLQLEEEYRALATICAEERFALEPTGGIDADNFEAILRIPLEAGVPQVIPHVYTSIIDPDTGQTDPGIVRELTSTVRRLVDAYA